MKSGLPPLRWLNKTVACVASGPSLTQEDCDLIQKAKIPCVAVNSSWKLARFCDVIYAGDDKWWKNYGDEIDIPAEQWTCLENTARIRGINRHGKFRGVSNSGARAIEFIVEEGAKKVILIGFDCSIKKGTHWHGDHDKSGNPTTKHCNTWKGHFYQISKQASKRDIQIINCSRETELTCFPRASLKETLNDSTNI